jgi:hypothetical protein
MGRFQWRATVGTWLSVAAIIVALGAVARPPAARADGDPASDVLVGQDLYPGYGVPTAPLPKLLATLNAAAHAGFPMRVALIANATDLGTVSSLWRQPTRYAAYLGTELSLTFNGPVLVVMPDGYGLYGHLTPALRTALSQLRAPGAGAGLITGTIAAIGRLAGAAGHPLPSLGGRGTSPSLTPGESHLTAWLAFWIGAAMIALAWGFSLRARPLRLRRRTITDPR